MMIMIWSLCSRQSAIKKKDELRAIASSISRAKDRNISWDSEELPLINHSSDFSGIYRQYEEKMARIGNVDFGALITKPVEILRRNADIARRMRDRFRIIMVDEYQDANVAQFELLKELFDDGTYLCVVGDDDQSIYKFRGAEIKNILKFPDMFGGADIIKLEQNYRSTGGILNLANSVIKNNESRHDKRLIAARGAGSKPELYFLDSQDSEAELCADLIKKSVMRNNAKYSDWAILYRTNAQSLGFENEFVRKKIPYKIIGSLKFYEREEIKDALALLSFMVNPRDEVSFTRVINKPARGIGGKALAKILDARGNDQDWDIEAALKKTSPALPAKARAGAEAFLAALNAGRSEISADNGAGKSSGKSALKYSQGLSVCVARLIEESGVAAHHLAHDDISGEQRVANLQELVNGAVLYEASAQGLLDFLERIELDRNIGREEDEENEERVTLITLHNTKGLEYRRVIITGLEQGLFPHASKKGEELEEERRLFYVGVTRAMDYLYLSSCAERRIWGRVEFMEPSLFLSEADLSGVKVSGKAGSRGFQLTRHSHYQTSSYQNTAFQALRKKSSDGRWAVGDRVFNEDRGYGEIRAIDETEDGPVIKVFFENGRIIKFLSAAHSKKYMKIKGEF